MNILTMQIQVGDILTRRKSIAPVIHYGVVVGNNLIVQNTPGKGEHAVTFREFAAGEQVIIKRSNVQPNVIVARAQAILSNPQKYDVFANNCEHTAAKIINGKSVSSQIFLWAGLFILGGVLYLISKKN